MCSHVNARAPVAPCSASILGKLRSLKADVVLVYAILNVIVFAVRRRA